MERHAVCSSFSLRAEQLELPLQYYPLNRYSPSSTTLSPSVCVCVCLCVEEDLAMKRDETQQRQLGRMTSEQADISATHNTCICRGTRLIFSSY